jgi:FtsZ-binding cell division protein ZapB
MRLSHLVRLAQKPNAQVEELKKQIENMDQTTEQLQRRMEALTGPKVPPNTAKTIKESIQRRIDAVQKDKADLQSQLQELMGSQKCECPEPKE